MSYPDTFTGGWTEYTAPPACPEIGETPEAYASRVISYLNKQMTYASSLFEAVGMIALSFIVDCVTVGEFVDFRSVRIEFVVYNIKVKATLFPRFIIPEGRGRFLLVLEGLQCIDK